MKSPKFFRTLEKYSDYGIHERRASAVIMLMLIALIIVAHIILSVTLYDGFLQHAIATTYVTSIVISMFCMLIAATKNALYAKSVYYWSSFIIVPAMMFLTHKVIMTSNDYRYLVAVIFVMIIHRRIVNSMYAIRYFNSIGLQQNRIFDEFLNANAHWFLFTEKEKNSVTYGTWDAYTGVKCKALAFNSVHGDLEILNVECTTDTFKKELRKEVELLTLDICNELHDAELLKEVKLFDEIMYLDRLSYCDDAEEGDNEI